MQISTEELQFFFLARAAGLSDTDATALLYGEIPVAENSFAAVPARGDGLRDTGKRLADTCWPQSQYRVLKLASRPGGIVERESSTGTLWRFTRLAPSYLCRGQDWLAEAFEPDGSPAPWRVANAFDGNGEGLANSRYGPHTPVGV